MSESMLDPRTMAPDDLREVVRQTHRAMKNAWVRQAESFQRIQDERLYLGYGFGTWAAYLNSDLPGLAPKTVEAMKLGLEYLKDTEPATFQMLMEGRSPISVVGYPTMKSLSSVATKSRVAPDIVSPDAYREAHEMAFSGALDFDVRKRCQELTKGVHKLAAEKEASLTPDERTLHDGTNKIALAADAIRKVGAIRKRGAVDVRPHGGHRGLASRLILLIQAMDSAFGRTIVDGFISEARKPAVGRKEISNDS